MTSATRARASLRWQDESGKSHELSLPDGGTLQLGRAAGNEIVLDTARASRHHASLTWRQKAFEVSDLGSTNGTYLNRQKLDRPRPLKHGDVIGIGGINLVFETVETSPTPTSPGSDHTLVIPLNAVQARFIVTVGFQDGRVIPLLAGKMTIGRATAKDSWDIALQDRTVSRPQALLEKTAQGFVLQDSGSANITLLNGKPLAEPKVLKEGDVIIFGETTVLFRGAP